jgi:hypothetical protein
MKPIISVFSLRTAMRFLPFAALIAAALTLYACDENAALANTSKRIIDMASECLLDTRDRGLKYEASSHCQKLGALSQAYFDAGGGDPKTPLRYEIIFEQARTTAWIAMAVSYSGKPGISIW